MNRSLFGFGTKKTGPSDTIIAKWILGHIFSFSNELSLEETLSKSKEFGLREHHYSRILQQIKKQKPVTFVLPAFPAKSPNPEKTVSDMPDMGEVVSLKFLHGLCADIAKIYSPGAKIVICSDGRVFSDLVLVTDEQVNKYRDGINNIIQKFQLDTLSMFNLEDVFPKMTFDEMREYLTKKYATPLDEVRGQVKTDDGFRQLFNGIHRFILEDRLVLENDTKNQIRKRSKDIAYQVIQRSNAWSSLVEDKFPEAVRLSIHPQAQGSKKIGIRMVNCENIWGTPWHNVLLHDGTEWRLVKKRDAEAQNAEKQLLDGEFAYYTLPKD